MSSIMGLIVVKYRACLATIIENSRLPKGYPFALLNDFSTALIEDDFDKGTSLVHKSYYKQDYFKQIKTIHK